MGCDGEDGGSRTVLDLGCDDGGGGEDELTLVLVFVCWLVSSSSQSSLAVRSTTSLFLLSILDAFTKTKPSPVTGVSVLVLLSWSSSIPCSEMLAMSANTSN